MVVDNGSHARCAIEEIAQRIPGAIFTGLPQNMGIAFAQNVGIQIARDSKASHVLTLDQDSAPDPKMVDALSVIVEQQKGSTYPVAAVGPLLKDEATQIALPLFSYSSGRKQRIIPSECSEVLEVEFLVSSGSLIAIQALREVGLMREELFIAYVDVEWCLRARASHYRIMVNCAATMKHNLGDRRIQLGNHLIPLHSPLRHFYLLRSGAYMQKLPYISKLWKKEDRRQLIRSFFIFSIAGLPRVQEGISMIRGLRAGLKMKIIAPKKLD